MLPQVVLRSPHYLQRRGDGASCFGEGLPERSIAERTPCEAASSVKASTGSIQERRREELGSLAWRLLLITLTGVEAASEHQAARFKNVGRSMCGACTAVALSPYVWATRPLWAVDCAEAHRLPEQGLQLRHRPGDHARDVEDGLHRRPLQPRQFLHAEADRSRHSEGSG